MVVKSWRLLPGPCSIPGTLIILAVGLHDRLASSSQPEFGRAQLTMLCIGVVLLILGYALDVLTSHIRPKIILTFVAVLSTYIFLEFVVSAVSFVAGLDAGESSSFWIFEDSGKTIHFDRIRGYTLTDEPSRFARVTNGTLEYLGTLKGNNYGFPDRDDYSPEMRPQVDRRFAVFGDSFTAAQYLEKNWPDELEDLAKATPDREFELLNFSTDGGGLANWWSNLIHILKAEEFEVGGLIFAVHGGDLNRGFSFAEHRGYGTHMFGRSSSWNPETWPKTLAEASDELEELPGYILSSIPFEHALSSRSLHIDEPAAKSPTEYLWIFSRLYAIADNINFSSSSREPEYNHRELTSGQLALIADIKRYITSRNVSAIVLHVPSRTELILQDDFGWKEQAKEFATALDGIFVDGSEAFKGLKSREIRAHWLPHDGHWNQSGSDRFARFVLKALGSRSNLP